MFPLEADFRYVVVATAVALAFLSVPAGATSQVRLVYAGAGIESTPLEAIAETDNARVLSPWLAIEYALSERHSFELSSSYVHHEEDRPPKFPISAQHIDTKTFLGGLTYRLRLATGSRVRPFLSAGVLFAHIAASYETDTISSNSSSDLIGGGALAGFDLRVRSGLHFTSNVTYREFDDPSSEASFVPEGLAYGAGVRIELRN